MKICCRVPRRCFAHVVERLPQNQVLLLAQGQGSKLILDSTVFQLEHLCFVLQLTVLRRRLGRDEVVLSLLRRLYNVRLMLQCVQRRCRLHQGSCELPASLRSEIRAISHRPKTLYHSVTKPHLTLFSADSERAKQRTPSSSLTNKLAHPST